MTPAEHRRLDTRRMLWRWLKWIHTHTEIPMAEIRAVARRRRFLIRGGAA